MPKFFKRSGSKSGNVFTDTARLVQRIMPHVQPKKWANFDQIKKDGSLVMQLFFSALNYFKQGEKNDRASRKRYQSTDDYLREQKLSPARLKQQLKRLQTYAWICYGLASLIFIYMLYILLKVSVLDGIICLFFALFVAAKGLQYSLFIRQVKSGNFDMKLKDIFI